VNGFVDDYGRPLVPLTVSSTKSGKSINIHGWIDTGFTGSLLLLPDQVRQLDLPPMFSLEGSVADGSLTTFETYLADVTWFGKTELREVLCGGGKFALVGLLLIEDLVVKIDYPAKTVDLSISPSA